MISNDRVEAALEFVRDNAARYGQLVGKCRFLEHQRKVVRGEQFLCQVDGTVTAREAAAECSDPYKAVVKDYGIAWAEKTILETKMKAAELTIEIWRSQNKWSDRGHV